jgi:DNA invertase Pin-like site-specific DNA recombinase
MRVGYNEVVVKYVAEYLRKSRGESTEDLIKHRTVLEELCQRRGWVYIAYEEIETGESLYARPVMQQLLRDISDNMYDAVVCVDLDRLGRGTLGEWDEIKRVFQRTQTYIVTPSSLYNLADDNDEFAVDLQTVFARREYKKITQRLSMGKKIGAKLGAWTNGTPPFPYEYQEWIDPTTHKRYFNEKGLVVNKQKLQIYRFIVDSYIKHRKSTNEIAWELNKKGILTPKGNRWHNNTIRRMLLDETHLGKIIYNKTKGDGHKNKPNKPKWERIPKDQWIVVENRHESVKTQDEHNKILITLNFNSTSAFKRTEHATPLKGLIKCGICGYGMTITRRNGQFLVKKCWYHDHEGNKCPNSGGKMQYIVDAIDEQLNEYEEQIKLELNTCEDQSTDLVQEQIKNISLQIKKKDMALQRARTAYDEGVDTLDEYRTAKDRINKEIEVLEYQLNIQNLRLQKMESITSHEKLHYIQEYREAIKNNTLTDKELNDLYKSIISHIVWTRQDDQIDIKVNFL